MPPCFLRQENLSSLRRFHTSFHRTGKQIIRLRIQILLLIGQQNLHPLFRKRLICFSQIPPLCVCLRFPMTDKCQYHLIFCPIPHITRSTSSAFCASCINILPVLSLYSLSNASTGTIPFPISSLMIMQLSLRCKNDCTSSSGQLPSDRLRLTH